MTDKEMMMNKQLKLDQAETVYTRIYFHEMNAAPFYCRPESRYLMYIRENYLGIYCDIILVRPLDLEVTETQGVTVTTDWVQQAMPPRMMKPKH